MTARRNLSDIDLSTNVSNSVFSFVPNGAGVTEVHRRRADPNVQKCHDPLQAHGGSRRLVEPCVLCHNPGGNNVQAIAPVTGKSIDFEVMIHKIPDGSSLPSVIAGQPDMTSGMSDSPATSAIARSAM